MCRRLFAVLVVALLVPAGTASAHAIAPTIAPPTSVPPEDSGFVIGFSGDVTSLSSGNGYLYARIRPTGGVPCAPSPDTDPGDRISLDGGGYRSVSGRFSLNASYVAAAPGDYLVCAWIEDGYEEWGPPASATVSVRPPIQQIIVSAPSSVRRGMPFTVTVTHQAEVPRYMTVLVVRASSCSVSSDAVRGISTSTIEIADDAQVSGTGMRSGTARLDEVGTYLVCGFLEESSYGTAAAQFVMPASPVVVRPPGARFRSCGSVGGPRRVRNVRARNVPCRSAKALARRWGNRRQAPRRLGSYRCAARSGRVTCSSRSARVTFRFGRA
jgi:hypothetical protein